MPGRIAVLSDVHGNLTAFEAVLADIEARGITRVFNLGDVVGKGPRGSEAIALHPRAVRGDGARQLGHLHRPRRAAALAGGASGRTTS